MNKNSPKYTRNHSHTDFQTIPLIATHLSPSSCILISDPSSSRLYNRCPLFSLLPTIFYPVPIFRHFSSSAPCRSLTRVSPFYLSEFVSSYKRFFPLSTFSSSSVHPFNRPLNFHSVRQFLFCILHDLLLLLYLLLLLIFILSFLCRHHLLQFHFSFDCCISSFTGVRRLLPPLDVGFCSYQQQRYRR